MPNRRDEAMQSPDHVQTEPPAKRSKLLSKVCETCKHRKARCDNIRPQCGNCRRKGVECIYREKGQPGLRPGFGKALEQRMDALESNVGRLANSLDGLMQQHQSSAGEDAGNHQPTPVSTLEARDMSGTFDGEARSIGLWQTPPPQPQQQPPMSQLPDGSGPGCGYQQTLSGAPERIPFGLPSREALLQMTNSFFQMVHPWCPLFLDPTAFIERLFQPGRELLLHGIVVAAIRFWYGVSNAEGEAYLKHSRDQILLQSIDQCTLVSTQALALLAVDALGRGTGPHCWNAMCMLVTAARHLGIAINPLLSNSESNAPLVRNDDEENEGESTEAEEKARLFWVICSLDRFSSVAHGQPGGIDTKTIRMPYPSFGLNEASGAALQWFNGTSQWGATTAKDTVNVWHQYIDILAFADRCNQLLIQPVNLFLPAHSQDWQNKFRALDADLSCWFASLPQGIHHQRQSFDVMSILLIANFHLIRIRMYTVAAFPSTTSPHVRASSSARLRCREAVAEVASLARNLQPSQLDHLGPHFAFVLWVSARSLIIIWTTGFDTNTTSTTNDLDALLSGLRRLSERWPSAGRYHDLIKLIQDTKDGPDGATGLDIFNDTRRTAHGLEKALGELSRRRNAEVLPSSLDFLDMPFLDNSEYADPTLPWMSSFGLETEDEWFR